MIMITIYNDNDIAQCCIEYRCTIYCIIYVWVTLRSQCNEQCGLVDLTVNWSLINPHPHPSLINSHCVPIWCLLHPILWGAACMHTLCACACLVFSFHGMQCTTLNWFYVLHTHALLSPLQFITLFLWCIYGALTNTDQINDTLS